MERQFELDSNNPTEDVDKAWDPGKLRDQSQDQ